MNIKLLVREVSCWPLERMEGAHPRGQGGGGGHELVNKDSREYCPDTVNSSKC
jgi:hypothetical protein